MEPLTHPALEGPRLPRMVGVSAALHLLVLLLVVATDLVRPRPDVFREVMRVDLVAPEPEAPEAAPAPQVTAPEPPAPPEAKAPPTPPPVLPPLRENALWAKMAQLDKPPPPPPPKETSLAKMWNEVAKTPPPKPTKPAPARPDDFKKWWNQWNQEMTTAANRPTAPAPAPVTVPERKTLSDAWRQINATLPEAVRLGEAELQASASGEFQEWWKKQVEGTLAPDTARQSDVAASSGTPQYLALIKQRVDARWSPPDIFRDHQEVVVVLAIDLAPDGRVRKVRIDRSSGSPFYDQAALRAILLSDPFPPFPKQVTEPSMQIRLTLSLDRGLPG